MGFQKVPLKKLTYEVNTAIQLLLNHHHVLSVNMLDRRFEVEMLLKTIEILSTKGKASPHKELVLNAMVYYIREEIAGAYKGTSPTNSVLYVNLGHALGLSDRLEGEIKSNQPNLADKRAMLECLYGFMKEKTYQEANPDKDYLPQAEQPYLTVKGFKPSDFLTKICDKVQELEKEAIKECKKRAEDQLKDSKSHASFLPTFGFLSTPPKGSSDLEKSTKLPKGGLDSEKPAKSDLNVF